MINGNLRWCTAFLTATVIGIGVQKTLTFISRWQKHFTSTGERWEGYDLRIIKRQEENTHQVQYFQHSSSVIIYLFKFYFTPEIPSNNYDFLVRGLAQCDWCPLGWPLVHCTSLTFPLPFPPASRSSPVNITSCPLQPTFPPGQPPSVVFANPPPPQMNPSPQPRQVGTSASYLHDSTTTRLHCWTVLYSRLSHICYYTFSVIYIKGSS